MPKWINSLMFGMTVSLLGVVLLMSGLTIERDFGLQWLFKLRGPIEAPENVAVIGISSRSGPAMGLSRLPRNWPRSLYAVLVYRLTASEVGTVVFDMDFSQPRVPVEDEIFADAIAASGRTVLFERLEGRSERIISQNNAARWVWLETSEPPAEPMAGAARAIAPFPLPKLDESSYQFWAFKPSADDTPTTASVAVQIALLPHHQVWRNMIERVGISIQEAPPATALQSPGALRDYMQRMRKLFLGQPFLADALVDLAERSELTPEESRSVRVLAALYGGPDSRYTNYYGPPGTIETIAFEDFTAVDDLGFATLPEEIKPTDTSARVAGQTVFIGYSDLFSPDQPDRFYTVFTNERGIDLSGCEIMATAFANLLSDESIRPAPAWLAVIVVAVFGFALSQLVFWPTAYLAIPLAFGFAAAYAVGSSQLFGADNLWLPMATPLAVQLPFAIVAGLLGQYLVERRQKRRVGDAIAQYLPKHIAEGITQGRIAASSINQVVHGVCLATDMSGFSRISESKSPGELAEFMNAYFETIAEALKRCEVDVTEFHADTIMCAWLGNPDDFAFRRKAIRAAVSVARAIEEFADDAEVPLRPRVGLQDGPFYLGHTGGGGRLSYSILGNPANSASRLEGLNKKLRTRVLAASSVVASVDECIVRPLGEFSVVGKSEYVDVVEVMGFSSERFAAREELLAGFALALEMFKGERWADALTAFRQVAAQFPDDGPTRFFRKLCKLYVTQGAPQTDPTCPIMTTK